MPNSRSTSEVKVLIDGYNLLHQSPTFQTGSGSQWLHQQRKRLVATIASLQAEKDRFATCIVFDAHTGKSVSTMDSNWEGIHIEFAHGYDQADDRIEEIILLHANPTSLTVVSSDRRLQTAARRRNAAAVDSRVWFDGLSLSNRKDNTDLVYDKPADDELASLNQIEVDRWVREILSSPEPIVPKRPLPKVRPKKFP